MSAPVWARAPSRFEVQARAYHTVRERVLYVLLLWARRPPDDFDSKTPSAATSRGPGGARMSVTQTSNSRRALLHQFTTDALEQAHDEGGRHGELARLLQALLAIIEQQMPYLFGGAPDAASVFRGGSAAPSGRGSFGGGLSSGGSSGGAAASAGPIGSAVVAKRIGQVTLNFAPGEYRAKSGS